MWYIQHDELSHHGIKGQKWGQRNGPPYPLGADDFSVREKKEKYKAARKVSKDARKKYKKAANAAYRNPTEKSERDLDRKEKRYSNAYEKEIAAKGDYKQAKKDRSTKEISNILGITESEAEQVKKYAKVVGISLATTAGLFAAGYFISRNQESIKNVLSGKMPSKNFDPSQIVENINSTGFNGTYNLSGIKGGIGLTASGNGYGAIGRDFLEDAIKNPMAHADPTSLVMDVRRNQVDLYPSGSRRLSCWSTSQSYWLSSLTGRDFCSKSYENLVNFNDFGKLYNKKPKIFDAFGNESSDFVGKFGRADGRIKFDEAAEKKFVSNIFNSIGASNNLTADGKKTVGFINAGYRGMTCTHEWNFEIHHLSGGNKVLQIVDGYVGESYPVAIRDSKGVINYFRQNEKFMQELYHYNVDSIRFYAPSLDSINTEALSKVVLGKK